MIKVGFVIWLTGLPASGKSTIANSLGPILGHRNIYFESLDGDEVRKWLSPEAAFSRQDRERHLKRVAYLCHLLSRNGVNVIASFVSPYISTREFARELIQNFVEVYVRCSLETCMKRDPKGLYDKASKGIIKDLTGVGDIYEEPLNPEVIIDTETENVEKCCTKIMNKLGRLGYL